jgi:alpha-beta hydrolase superfamily lysophospholipase
MRYLILLLFLCLHSAFGQRPVSFPVVPGRAEIQADLYGEGSRALILAHGGRFNKESWKVQAEAFAREGFLVLAVRFRGDGLNPDGTPGTVGSSQDNADDILAAAVYLRSIGAKSVSAIGASLGGDAVGDADGRSARGTFDRIVILASSGGEAPAKLKGRKLFIVTRSDASASGPRLPEISKSYAKTPRPKKMVIMEGSAHAQFIFTTDQGPLLLSTILQFLEEP